MAIEREVEQVLVVDRRILDELGLFEGISFQIDRYLEELWTGRGVSFMARPEAEKNPGYKQIIPYVIMAHANTYLCYTRGTGVDEARLAEKISLGVGGHINPSDAGDALHRSVQRVYLNAVAREVEEEVIVETEHDDNIVALINDDSNEVGRVHFGVVHFWRLFEPKVRSRECDIRSLTFLKSEQLRQMNDKMETWSQLCLDGLEQIVAKTRGRQA
jgi:predicted NUDIX family phosphoesterase